MLGALSADEIEDVLRNEVIGRIGFLSEGWPCVVPITYVYDGGDYIYFHSTEGEKTDAMRKDGRVCFEVEQIRAMGNWRTVMARGTVEKLAIDDEDEQAMELLARKFAWSGPGSGARDRHEEVHRLEGVTRPLVFRIRLMDRYGRFQLS
jgi:nitroimidazol reductase NimA-like FMN-containing flavoprotein (pyridoxamine 5'-phosphate oxidase superfamily)